ncbi:glycogen synthase [Allofournierella massiliensis]|uniref:Glycogen synthase n=1 Tax=Allofournierella massiliensis TaxID=1650663 RepID=A0A4R1R5T3_9FIRM|nr:starch synthase [Fournierella massiliensis]
MAQKKAQSNPKKTAEAKGASTSAKKTAEPVKAVPAKSEPVTKTEPAAKAEPAKKAEPAAKAEPAKKAEPAAKAESAKKAEPAAKAEPVKKAEPAAKAEPAEKAEPAVKAEPAKKTKTAAKKPAAKKAKPAAKKAETEAKKPVAEEAKPAEPVAEVAAPVAEQPAAPVAEPAPAQPQYDTPRRSVAFIGSECHPFVKTGGLGDVMYALPRELVNQNCDVRVILPRYACIPQKYQDKMVYRGEFYMDLGETGRSYYVGIMEYICDGVVYDFIDNQEFFTDGNPYVSLVDDIPKYCFFSKAALAALNYMNWIPDVIHCHDWQAALVPVYLRTLFKDSPVGRAKTVLTIHNLRFQGIYNIPTIRYWSGLPAEVFNMGALQQAWRDANMLKGGLAYADRITTVSNTYAWEIQTPEYGEQLEDHLRYHSYKLRGIVNGIDYGMWNPATDPALAVNYDITNVLERKPQNKLALQKELGLVEDEGKLVVGLISRLTNQKGLDLVNAIVPQIMDGNTQVVVLGTGDKEYEDTFRYYENAYKGMFSACIQYDEARAHRIYAGADVLLVPSRFEPCGLTQLNAMHYGTLPIVRETGGLKDTVQPYNVFNGEGNGFTFDRYDAGLLLDAINRAKTEYFTSRYHWDEVVQRDMAKDVSWANSARQYKDLYLELTPW